MGMIGAIRFPRRDADEGEVKGMSFGEIEGMVLATEGDGNFFDGFAILPTGRLALLCGNMSQVNFFHDITRTDKPRQGVVANTLNSFRTGPPLVANAFGVGFTEWLDDQRW